MGFVLCLPLIESMYVFSDRTRQQMTAVICRAVPKNAFLRFGI